MQESILQTKRKNLLNINKNGPEIFINRGFINIYKFISPNNLVNFIENKNIMEFQINKMSLINEISGMLNGAQTIQQLSILAKKYYFTNTIFLSEEYNGDFISYRKNIVKKMVKERGNEIDQLLKFAKSASAEYYESSKWCFYLCYGTLEGKINSLSNIPIYLRAPLLCVPVSIVKSGTSSLLLYKRGGELINNEILKVYLQDNLDRKIFNDQYLDEQQFSIDFYLNDISSKLPKTYIEQEPSNIEKVNKKEFIDNLEIDKLKITKSSFVAFFMPVGGKMLEDYDYIINSDFIFPTNNDMFLNSSIGDEIYETDSVVEINRPLNLIQKKAVISSLKTNILIYGPPGTGKSEVVTNIITNHVCNKKNVLVVSEKKAALDVIMDRLGKLKNITLATYDDQDQNFFYDQIINLNKLIVSANPIDLFFNKNKYTNIKKYIHEINNFIRESIDFDISKLSNIDSSKIEQYNALYFSLKNKAVDEKMTIIELVNNFKLFDKNINQLKVLNPEIDNLSFCFQIDRLKQLIQKYDSISENDKKFKLIKNYIQTKEIKIPFSFSKKVNEEQNAWQEKIVSIFKDIISKKILYFVYYEKWKILLSLSSEEVNDIISFVESNNKLHSQFINEIKKNNIFIQDLLDEYWTYKNDLSRTIDIICCDFYLYQLKQTMISSKELQAKWIELVRKANLPKKINFSKIVKQYYDLLKLIYPIWILSPDNVASMIPLNKNEFSCGIFDEASQIRLERGIPLVYRCTNSVVSGDDKQLKPSTFFAAKIDLEDFEDEELDNVESLLDKSKTSNWVDFTLSNHYRSVNEQLIAFSNKYIYNNQLLCITKNNCFSSSIQTIELNGIYSKETNTNLDEANKVIELINDNFDKYKKIIVITFNQKQATLIENLALSDLMLNNKIENHLLKIRSLENIQGDEGDLVIISTTFGKTEDGKFIQNFGPINQSSGKNRINVMVTRAKDKMIIVKSFKSEDITNTNNENTFILKMFFSYIENIQNENESIQKNQHNSCCSFLAEDIFNHLRQKIEFNDLLLVKNLLIGTHKYDIALKDKNDFVILGIIIDDFQKMKTSLVDLKKWIDTFDQQKYYQDREYTTLRINEVEWKINKNHIIDKIKLIILKRLKL